ATYISSEAVTVEVDVVDVRYFAKIRAAVNAYVADGTTSAKTAANVLERLDRAETAARAGSEERAIGFLEQFIARVENQVKGDAADVAARNALTADAALLLAYYQAMEDAENVA
ncbi:FIMAH domain-containing protein, partial [Motilibacter aurantiacus]|uniref:FIMAH domain-containing protein n=1 Tax=Motilibacter aurantiacus TaxID=2714955 RepID=UPI00140B38E8